MGQTPAGSTGTTGAPSLKEKINHLFEVVRPSGQDREFSLPEVRRGLDELGCQVSVSYISQLRTGKSDNPSKDVLEGLARFFGVSPLYFFDDAEAVVIEKELSLLSAMQDARIRAIALRASTLNGTDLDLLMRITETIGEPRKPTYTSVPDTPAPAPAAKTTSRRRPAPGAGPSPNRAPAKKTSARKKP